MNKGIPSDDQEIVRLPMAIRFRAAYGQAQVNFEISYAALGILYILIKILFPH
jgi:hypothetical protein